MNGVFDQLDVQDIIFMPMRMKGMGQFDSVPVCIEKLKKVGAYSDGKLIKKNLNKFHPDKGGDEEAWKDLWSCFEKVRVFLKQNKERNARQKRRDEQKRPEPGKGPRKAKFTQADIDEVLQPKRDRSDSETDRLARKFAEMYTGSVPKGKSKKLSKEDEEKKDAFNKMFGYGKR